MIPDNCLSGLENDRERSYYLDIRNLEKYLSLVSKIWSVG